ncbi:hypothetical protein EMCRGX_G003311 [Ephydatia muelleri]
MAGGQATATLSVGVIIAALSIAVNSQGNEINLCQPGWIHQVGDEVLEINGNSTEGMGHADAITIIKNGGDIVKLTVRRLPESLFLGIVVHGVAVWTAVERLVECTAVERLMEWTAVERLVEWTAVERLVAWTAVERLVEWTAVERQVEWTAVERLVEWIAVERLVEWIDVERLVEWTAVERLVEWIAVERLVEWTAVGSLMEWTAVERWKLVGPTNWTLDVGMVQLAIC